MPWTTAANICPTWWSRRSGCIRFDRESLTRYFALLHYDFTEEYQTGTAPVLRAGLRGRRVGGGAGAALHRRGLRGRPAGARGRAPAEPAGAAGRRRAERSRMTRMTDKEALELLRSRDLLEVGARAHEVRERLVPGPLATFIVDRNINYTNVCISGCRFCAFHCAPGAPEAYVLSQEVIHDKIQETARPGRHGHHDAGRPPSRSRHHLLRRPLPLDQGALPDLTIHSLSAPEIVHIAKVSGLTTAETLRAVEGARARLAAGWRRRDPGRQRAAAGGSRQGEHRGSGCDVMREAHLLGIAGTATMMFGSVETLEDRVEHLRVIRELQDETGGFRAFIPWSFQSGNTAGRRRPSRPPAWTTS